MTNEQEIDELAEHVFGQQRKAKEAEDKLAGIRALAPVKPKKATISQWEEYRTSVADWEDECYRAKAALEERLAEQNATKAVLREKLKLSSGVEIITPKWSIRMENGLGVVVTQLEIEYIYEGI